MKLRRVLPLLSLPLALLATGGAVARPVPGAPACPMFPSNSVYHADISKLPVNTRSAAWLRSMSSSTTKLHPDFGPSYGEQSVPYGIPFNVVGSDHALVKVTFEYASESTRVGYPLGPGTPIEGGAESDGDRHALIVNRDTCRLYETWNTHYRSGGRSTAGSGAVWALKVNGLRPDGFTSADAAGLPILPLLLRYDEVKAGNVDHAIRFTAQRTDKRHIWPARHHAGYALDANLPPMGARFRLKASYNISGFRADTQVVLRAMKKHGMMLADNGSNWFFQGTADNAWPSGLISQLKSVPASAFEAVNEASLMDDPNSGRVRTP
jgi:hypothetical protein